jgi:hypothetical protein
MTHIKIQRSPAVAVDDLAVELRADLPFRDARCAAIDAFEVAYLSALFRRHAELEEASRASGIATADLAVLRRRFARGTGVHRVGP